MISIEQIKDLLNKPISGKELVLVHGTSTHAIIKMFETGKLPSSRTIKNPEDIVYRDYLFFIPRLKAFKNHHLYREIHCDYSIEELKRDVSIYAEINQKDDFVQEHIGDLPEDVDMEYILKNILYPSRLKRRKVNINKVYSLGVDKIQCTYDSQKGVMLGINKKIFETNIEEGKDDYEEVCIKLPEGLDIKYVAFIHLYSNNERKIIKNWIKQRS
ncbi:MAG: hypothetical protein PHU51_01665 [Candidatus Nanoarchaeia archaeon]|nr:hypothetical protein [Candidatus Nanoarchaeia archaeon]